jgi:recombination protein RecT
MADNKQMVKYNTVRGMVEKYKDHILQALPKQIDKERFLRICLTQFTRNPKLMDCTATSLVGSLIESAMIGLEPDGTHAALIPYKNHGVLEAQLQPMYQGLIQLARRAGLVSLIYAEVVYEKDPKFEIQRGLNPNLEHIPLATGNRGKFLGAYAVYRLRSGDADFEWMTADEINKVKSVSKSGKNTDSPWKSWPDEMAKKTVIKRLAKRAPKEAGDDLQRAIEIDNRNDYEKRDYDFTDVFKSIGALPPADAAQPVNHIESPKRKSGESEETPLEPPDEGGGLNQGKGGEFKFKQPRPGSPHPIGGGGAEPDADSDDFREELPFPEVD